MRIFILLLFGAAVLRMLLAPLGAFSDTADLRNWMDVTAKHGIVPTRDEYAKEPVSDYPTVSMGLLMTSGIVFYDVLSLDEDENPLLHRVFGKLPGMISDLVTMIILFVLFAGLGRTSAGLTAAGIYGFNPAVFVDSTSWGQMDSVYTMFLVACLAFLVRGKPAWGSVMFIFAVFSKTYALFLLPLVLMMMPWRSRDMLRVTLVSLFVMLLFILPYAVADRLPSLLHTFNPAGIIRNSHLTWDAFNVWWLKYGTIAGVHGPLKGTDLIYGPVSFNIFGTSAVLLLFGYFLAIGGRIVRRGPPAELRTETIFLSATLCTFALFLFGPEMHERYFFAAIAFALPLVFFRKSYAVLYGVISVLFYLNLTYTFPYHPIDKALFATFPSLGRLIALCFWFCFMGYAYMLWVAEEETRKKDAASGVSS